MAKSKAKPKWLQQRNKILAKLTLTEAAEYCKVNKQTLYQLRNNGGGPISHKEHFSGLGKGPAQRVVYYVADLDNWNAARKMRRPARPQVATVTKLESKRKPTKPNRTTNRTNMKKAA